jgi:hypothetical protein
MNVTEFGIAAGFGLLVGLAIYNKDHRKALIFAAIILLAISIYVLIGQPFGGGI